MDQSLYEILNNPDNINISLEELIDKLKQSQDK